MEERPFHPLDYLTVLQRRKWWLIVPIVASLAVGLVALKVLPKEFRSHAKIGVAAPTLSNDLLRGLSSLDAVERQRAVSQHLLGTTVLERVMREEQVLPDARPEDRAAWLRNRVTIEVEAPFGVSTRAADRGFDSFKLGFKDSEPARTQQIANKLARVFVEENSKYTTARAELTADVLGEQLKQSQDRLTELEGQLSAKKQKHMGRLPSMMDANLSMANGARLQLESISQQLRMEQQQLSLVESQLQQMRQGVGTAPLTSTATVAIQSTQGRLNLLQQQLTQARANGWTDKHPEVMTLQEEIKQARAELTGMKQDGNHSEELKSDPIYVQKLAERDATMARLRSLRQGADQARAQISQFQSRVEAAPIVEQDLSSVQRDYDLERLRYADLKTKYDTALMQGNVARNQGVERFTILYAAGPAELISAPGYQVLALALIVGLVLGATLLIGREFLDRSVHDTRDLQSEFEIPVLGEIPRIQGA
jgi:polysaccharide chain length determinant protein (PEP-CTERM system associated)